MDDNDTCMEGVANGTVFLLMAIDDDRALVGRLIAGQNADQRRLSRAVLSHQSVNRAFFDVEGDVGKRLNARITFGDILEFKESHQSLRRERAPATVIMPPGLNHTARAITECPGPCEPFRSRRAVQAIRRSASVCPAPCCWRSSHTC